MPIDRWLVNTAACAQSCQSTDPLQEMSLRGWVYCWCDEAEGLPEGPRRLTSKTAANPDRDFFKCDECDFFRWVDEVEPTCDCEQGLYIGLNMHQWPWNASSDFNQRRWINRPILEASRVWNSHRSELIFTTGQCFQTIIEHAKEKLRLAKEYTAASQHAKENKKQYEARHEAAAPSWSEARHETCLKSLVCTLPLCVV